jgi:hypothetical protein
MFKISAPNTAYNGESAGVKFSNGVGETEDPNIVSWFQENGYKVEEQVQDTGEGSDPVDGDNNDKAVDPANDSGESADQEPDATTDHVGEAAEMVKADQAPVARRATRKQK